MCRCRFMCAGGNVWGNLNGFADVGFVQQTR